MSFSKFGLACMIYAYSAEWVFLLPYILVPNIRMNVTVAKFPMLHFFLMPILIEFNYEYCIIIIVYDDD